MTLSMNTWMLLSVSVLERVRRCGLVGRGVSGDVGSKVSEANARSSLSVSWCGGVWL